MGYIINKTGQLEWVDRGRSFIKANPVLGDTTRENVRWVDRPIKRTRK